MGKVGIVGYRSWIARELADQVRYRTDHEVVLIEKHEAPDVDCRDHLTLFIIPGKLVQTQEEMTAERNMVRAVAESPLSARRQILLSSMSAETRTTEYGMHKYLTELAFQYGAGIGRKQIALIRPGAIFGPGQDLDAPMLIPQLARQHGFVDLQNPDKPTKFISVTDLCRCLVGLISASFATRTEDDIPGTFTATPSAIKDLYHTFNRMVPRG